MPPEIRPRAVFERLFGVMDGERDPAKRRARQLSAKAFSTWCWRMRSASSAHSAAPTAASSTNTCLPSATSKSGFKDRSGTQRVSPRRVDRAFVQRTDGFRRACAHHDAGFADAGVSDRFHARGDGASGIEQSPRIVRPRSGSAKRHHGLTHHQGDKEKIEKGDADQLLSHSAIRLSAG